MTKKQLLWHTRPGGLWNAIGASGTFYTLERGGTEWVLEVSMGNTAHELWSPSARAGRAMAQVIEDELLEPEDE